MFVRLSDGQVDMHNYNTDNATWGRFVNEIKNLEKSPRIPPSFLDVKQKFTILLRNEFECFTFLLSKFFLFPFHKHRWCYIRNGR